VQGILYSLNGLLLVSFSTQKSTILKNTCNLQIPNRTYLLWFVFHINNTKHKLQQSARLLQHQLSCHMYIHKTTMYKPIMCIIT